MNTIVDIYTVDESGKPKQAAMSTPFQMVVSLAGPQGERVRFLAMVDNGVMINAIDMNTYQSVARRMAP